LRPEDPAFQALPEREIRDYLIFIEQIAREESIQRSKGAPRGRSR
jgi:hypothetical protein